MHPIFRVAGYAVLAGAAVAGFMHAAKEQKQREKVYHQNMRAAPKYQDKKVDDKSDVGEDEDVDNFEELVSIFKQLTSTNVSTAQHYLKNNGYDMERAVSSFYDEGGEALSSEVEEEGKTTTTPISLSEEPEGETIAIDLGTAFSCVGVWQDGSVEIISNELGNRTTPSLVSFTENAIMVGETAKLQAVTNAPNTLYNTKRLIGRNFTDHNIQADMERWPFAVVSGPGDTPSIEVNWQGKNLKLKAEDISCMLLKKMKKIAETYLEKRVTDAVITVPAHFNYSQRQAVMDAGSRAGLNARIMNETTAAALAYGFDKKQEDGEETVLVFDLGGGSLDVSLLTIDEGIIEIEATAYSRLGGDDFDNCLVDYVLSEIKHCYDHDFSKNQRVRMSVYEECKRVKHILSSSTQTSIEVLSLLDDLDFKSTITREQFENMCMDYFIKCIDPVEKVLHDVSRISKADIDEVVLVGGSTRIPKVQKLLTDFFDGKELNKALNPDEAIAYGATVQAAMLIHKKSNFERLPELRFFDVIPFSLGIETDGGEMTTMVKRKTTFPFKERILFTTNVDNQTSVLIRVFEGESSLTQNNNFLGEFICDGITAMPRGKPQIDVTFEITSNGILCVSVTEMLTGKSKQVTVTGTSKREFTGMSNTALTLWTHDDVAMN